MLLSQWAKVFHCYKKCTFTVTTTIAHKGCVFERLLLESGRLALNLAKVVVTFFASLFIFSLPLVFANLMQSPPLLNFLFNFHPKVIPLFPVSFSNATNFFLSLHLLHTSMCICVYNIGNLFKLLCNNARVTLIFVLLPFFLASLFIFIDTGYLVCMRVSIELYLTGCLLLQADITLFRRLNWFFLNCTRFMI